MPRRTPSPAPRLRPLWLVAAGLSLAVVLWFTLREDEYVTSSNLTGRNFVPLRHHLAALRCWLDDCPAADAALEYLLIDVVGNVLLFVPLGLTFAVASTRDGRWGRLAAATLSGFLLSLLIEVVQLAMPSRASDVDDVIFNTVGTLAGAAVGVILFRRAPAPSRRKPRRG
ncbi:MAG TPA: VanZ family protein [Thermoanaerobaculia bacterium]|nr:VanZ family protein [Thermoanaerobaculia bacterium]